jgi:hypothetical protein
MANGDESCWCCELPHVLPVSGGDAQCYCRACLERLIEQRRVASPGSGVE